MKFELSSGLILFRRKRGKQFYFLLQHPSGSWGFPKGLVEKGESLIETAKRETVEETGIRNFRILEGFKKETKWFYYWEGKKVFKKAFFFLAETQEEKFKISWEHKDGGWFSYQEAIEKLEFENYRKILKEANDFINSFAFSFYRNLFEIAKTKERLEALSILAEGIKASLPESILEGSIRKKNDCLYIKDRKILLSSKRIFFVGIGKAAKKAANYLRELIPFKQGFILDPTLGRNKQEGSFVFFKVGHPFPTKESIVATQRVIDTLSKLRKDDLVLFFVSGGGSASFELPAACSLEEEVSLIKDLFKVGASIEELNTIRKHISKVKGGGLAKIVYPARIISLIFSDVVGDKLDVIASGPTVLDTTTKEEALRILKKYNLFEKYKNLEFVETPKEKKYFRKASNFLLLTNKVALKSMKKEALRLGYEVKIVSNTVKGEAREVGKELVKKARKKELLLAGGETTVTIKGKGRGGRNQELVLGALTSLRKDTLIISLASDGRDNSEVAGAIGDALTLKKAKEKNLAIEEYLADNNSYVFFQRIGDQIITGSTGTNVADLMLVLRR